MSLLSREKSEFFHISESQTESLFEPKVFFNCLGKSLSSNKETGQISEIVELPPEWKGIHDSGLGTLEIFILKGSLICDLEILGAGSFLAIPVDNGTFSLKTQTNTDLFIVYSPHFSKNDFYNGEIFVAQNYDRNWSTTEFPGEISSSNQLHGVLSQSLRWPDPIVDGVHGSNNGLLRLVCIAPGFIGDNRQESHPDCWEVIFWLSGDFFMPGTGLQAPGSYLTNPPGHIHGPLVSQKGSVMLVHTDSPAGFDFHEPPIDRALLENHLEGQSWMTTPTLQSVSSDLNSHDFQLGVVKR